MFKVNEWDKGVNNTGDAVQHSRATTTSEDDKGTGSKYRITSPNMFDHCISRQTDCTDPQLSVLIHLPVSTPMVSYVLDRRLEGSEA